MPAGGSRVASNPNSAYFYRLVQRFFEQPENLSGRTVDKVETNNAPIGIFDSGLGGLSVWKEVVSRLPEESVIYYGDGKNCPYGPKDPGEVLAISEAIVRCLISRGAKLIVVACNSATAAAITTLRERFEVPFVGMEPAVKPAALNSRTGVIGILATHATLNGKMFKETAERFSGTVEILSGIGRDFVELIENGMEDSAETEQAVRDSVEPLLERGADHLVLGCTHYPFLTGALKKVIGDRDVRLIDPAPAVAHRVAAVLRERTMRADAGHVPHYTFLSSAGVAYADRLRRKADEILSSAPSR